MRHLAELREDRLNQSGDMADFRFFISILDFQKLEILIAGPVWRPNMRHRAKFHEDRSSHSRDMANFRFFKMAAVRHLGFVLRVLGPPTYSIWWSLSLCKIGCNWRSNFDSMQILIFCTLSLKVPIHAPKIGVLGGFYPQNGEQYERDPQKAHPWVETRCMTYRSSKSVHVCGLGACRRIEQKKFFLRYT